MNKSKEKWNDGNPYEYFMGRWSKLMAPKFLDWLNFPKKLKWLDIGCGTGVLGEAIYRYSEPAQLFSIDPSEGFLSKAKERLHGKGEFMLGNVSELPLDDQIFDIVVSGLALNFFPDLNSALTEMKRVLKPNGTIAAYVWDYSDRIDFLRYFWDAAVSIDAHSNRLDEGVRFPICNLGYLKEAFQNAGMYEIAVTKLDIITVFKDFDDYWNPFLGGQGPAPGYLASLSGELKEELKINIKKKMPIESDGSISLLARALAIRGKSDF